MSHGSNEADGVLNRKILAALCDVKPAVTAEQGLSIIRALRDHLSDVFARSEDPMFVNAEFTLNALQCLVARFAIEKLTEKTTGFFCNCNQFEDNDDCRHAMAIRAIHKSRGSS